MARIDEERDLVSFRWNIRKVTTQNKEIMKKTWEAQKEMMQEGGGKLRFSLSWP